MYLYKQFHFNKTNPLLNKIFQNELFFFTYTIHTAVILSYITVGGKKTMLPVSKQKINTAAVYSAS